MLSLQEWKRRQQAQERSRRLMGRLKYRQSLREISINEKNLNAVCEQMRKRAMDAENAGNHSLAVHWAQEAQKLKKYLMLSGNMKNNVEITHAIGETNTAMAGLVSAAGSLAADISQTDPCALQIETEALQTDAQIILEQSEELFDSLPGTQGSADNEAGEKYLKELLEGARREKQAHMLQDTNRRLDMLQKARTLEKPR